nr:MAG: DNA pilot protein [Microvirus sp.]
MGLFSAIGSIVTTSMTNKANAKEAAKSRDFSREEMQNRHQWEVSDLRKAGLNPVLSAGAAPSIGSSAQATMQSPDVSGLDEKELMSSAMEWKRLNAELDNIKSDTGQKDSADKLNTEALKTQKTQQMANSAQAAASAALAGLYGEQKRGQSLENDKQQVLKAGYDAAAPLVERVVGKLKNSASEAYSSFGHFKKPAPSYTKIDWSKVKTMKGK